MKMYLISSYEWLESLNLEIGAIKPNHIASAVKKYQKEEWDYDIYDIRVDLEQEIVYFKYVDWTKDEETDVMHLFPITVHI
jgi:hypothetical protein